MIRIEAAYLKKHDTRNISLRIIKNYALLNMFYARFVALIYVV